MNTTTCTKCHGTGFVSAFAHVKNGLCFDCGGTGVLRIARTVSRHSDPRVIARAIGDMVIAGTPVDMDDATNAFEFFEDLHPTRWSEKDYDRRNTLGRLIGRVI